MELNWQTFVSSDPALSFHTNQKKTWKQKKKRGSQWPFTFLYHANELFKTTLDWFFIITNFHSLNVSLYCIFLIFTINFQSTSKVLMTNMCLWNFTQMCSTLLQDVIRIKLRRESVNMNKRLAQYREVDSTSDALINLPYLFWLIFIVCIIYIF